MMAYKSGFFNSMNGDRKYNAEDMSHFYGQLISNGVLSKAESSLQVSAGTGLTVTISKGWAWINTHWFYNDSPITLTVSTTDTNPRKDSVILRLNNEQQADGRSITPMILEGDSSNYPEPTRTDLIYDIVLAHIDVPNNVTSINNQYIMDTRADTNLCGWVTGLITQVDTTTLFKQWQSAYMEFYIEFTSWFNDLTETLGIATFNNRIEINAISSKNQMNFKPNVADYDTSDILDVYINNFRLTPNIDYTFSGNGANLNISFKNALDSDNNISVVILQSKKGVSTSNFQSIDTVAPPSNVNSISAIFSTYERID
jgi:hypothetical protein